jgi:hypothetical protein
VALAHRTGHAREIGLGDDGLKPESAHERKKPLKKKKEKRERVHAELDTTHSSAAAMTPVQGIAD